jgi:hypothetical protein
MVTVSLRRKIQMPFRSQYIKIERLRGSAVLSACHFWSDPRALGEFQALPRSILRRELAEKPSRQCPDLVRVSTMDGKKVSSWSTADERARRGAGGAG